MGTGGGHLWYLLLIPQLYVLFQIWPISSRGLVVGALAAVALQVALCSYRLLAPADAPLNGFLLAHGYQLAPLWVGYFGIGLAVGRWRAEHLDAWNSWRLTGPFAVAMVAGAVLLVLANGSSTPNATFAQGTGAFLLPSLIPLAVATWAVWGLAGERLMPRWPAVSEAVKAVGRYSLGIYIVHEALTYVSGPVQYWAIARASLAVSLLLFVFQVLVTFVLAYVVARVLAATRLAITIGLPAERLRWSQWRRPFAV